MFLRELLNKHFPTSGRADDFIRDLLEGGYDIFDYSDPMCVDWSRIKFSLIEDVLIDPVEVRKHRDKSGPGHYKIQFRWVRGDDKPQDTRTIGIAPAMARYNTVS